VEDGQEGHAAQNAVCLGDLSALLELCQHWVLGKLLIELSNVVVELVGRLDHGGVLLNLLLGGHYEHLL